MSGQCGKPGIIYSLQFENTTCNKNTKQIWPGLPRDYALVFNQGGNNT